MDLAAARPGISDIHDVRVLFVVAECLRQGFTAARIRDLFQLAFLVIVAVCRGIGEGDEGFVRAAAVFLLLFQGQAVLVVDDLLAVGAVAVARHCLFLVVKGALRA